MRIIEQSQHGSWSLRVFRINLALLLSLASVSRGAEGANMDSQRKIISLAEFRPHEGIWVGKLFGESNRCAIATFSSRVTDVIAYDRIGKPHRIEEWFVQDVPILKESPTIVFPMSSSASRQWDSYVWLSFPTNDLPADLVRCDVKTPLFPDLDPDAVDFGLMKLLGSGTSFPETKPDTDKLVSLSGTASIKNDAIDFRLVANDGGVFLGTRMGESRRLMPSGVSYTATDSEGLDWPLLCPGGFERAYVWLTGRIFEESTWRYSIPVCMLTEDSFSEGFPAPVTSITLDIPIGYMVKAGKEDNEDDLPKKVVFDVEPAVSTDH